MKQTSLVTSIIARLKFAEGRIENYFNRASEIDAGKMGRDDFEAIVWRFAHTSASGKVEIVIANTDNNKVQCMEIPVFARFIVSGVKDNGGKFRIGFGISMS